MGTDLDALCDFLEAVRGTLDNLLPIITETQRNIAEVLLLLRSEP